MRIIENDECSECKKQARFLISIGEPTGFEPMEAWVCFRCIRKAFRMLMETPPVDRYEGEIIGDFRRDS